MEYPSLTYYLIYTSRMKKYVFIWIILMFFAGCRKDDSANFEGPDLNDLYGPFSIMTDLELPNQFDFSTGGSIAFSLEISKQTNWVIEITGQSSGAKRIIQGKERIISADNASWKGGADQFPSFGLESAIVSISFPEEEGAITLYDTIEIKGLKIDDGILITSFESGMGTNWNVFNQTTTSGGINCNSGMAAKGQCSYVWDGLVPWDWAVGSVMIKPDSTNFGLPSNANNLFFNMAVKFISNIGTTNSFIQFWFDEDDNGDGVFDEDSEDRFIYEYWYKDNNWQLVSINYADLMYDEDGEPRQLNGNSLPEPSKLIGINVFFLANKDNPERSKAEVDHIIFTTNQSYKP